MSNNVPNKIINGVPGDPPWISRSLKNMLNKQNRLFQNYKRHGYKFDDKNRVDNFRKECKMAVKRRLFKKKKLCERLINPNASQKFYDFKFPTFSHLLCLIRPKIKYFWYT